MFDVEEPYHMQIGSHYLQFSISTKVNISSLNI